MGVSVRVADGHDVAALAALRRAWNDEHFGQQIDDPAFEGRFAQWHDQERPTRTFFIAERDGVSVGMANVKRYQRMPSAGRDGGAWGYAGNVFVLEEHRNEGIGRALMEHLIAWAGAEGLAHVRLAPSPRSRSFYERLGFTPGAVVELDPPAG